MILPGLYPRRPGLVPTSTALSLSATWTSGPAPMGVFFEATAAGFPVSRPLHHLRYRWSFGDAGSWGKVTRLWDRDRNVAYGPWAVHTFESAGTYTVTCEVTDGTTTVSESIDITVLTPEAYFGASHIFAVSQAGDFTGAPAGAAQFTDLRTALDASRSNSPNSSPQPKACILLRAGETFDGGDFFERCGFRVRDGFMLNSFGDGGIGDGRALVDAGNGGVQLGGTQAPDAETYSFSTVANIEIFGDYNPLTGLKGHADAVAVNFGRTEGDAPQTLHNCVLRGLNRTFNGNKDAIEVGDLFDTYAAPVISDCATQAWENFNFGALGLDRGGLVGSTLLMHPKTPTGPGGRADGTGPDWVDHGPFRSSVIFRFTFRQNDMFSRAGWSDTADPGGAHQQCMRLQSEGGELGQGMIDRCLLEGGFTVVNAFANSGAQPRGAHPCDYIFDKSVLLASPNTRNFVSAGFGGMTIRNCLMVVPGTPHENFGHKYVILPEESIGTTPDAAGNDTPIEVYNNTVVDLRTSAQAGADESLTCPGQTSGPFEDTTSAFPNGDVVVHYDNNILHQPNLDTPNTAQGPLEDGPALVWPLYDGERLEEPTSFDVAHLTPTRTVAEYKPLAGSPAIGGGSTARHFALDDFAGTLRGGTIHAGAWEATGTADTDGTGPSLTGITAAVAGTTGFSGSVTVDEPARIWWVLTGSATAPSAAQVKAHEDHTGTYLPMAQYGIAFADAAGAVALGIAEDGPEGGLTPATTYYLHVYAEDRSGNPSTVGSAAGSVTTVDMAAPVLANAVDAADGQTASTGSVETDTAEGMLHAVVYAATATDPDATQIRAGTDGDGAAAAWSGSQSVTTTGTQALAPAPSGLSADTAYRTAFAQEDAATGPNLSAPAIASGFTTAPAPADPLFDAGGPGSSLARYPATQFAGLSAGQTVSTIADTWGSADATLASGVTAAPLVAYASGNGGLAPEFDGARHFLLGSGALSGIRTIFFVVETPGILGTGQNMWGFDGAGQDARAYIDGTGIIYARQNRGVLNTGGYSAGTPMIHMVRWDGGLTTESIVNGTGTDTGTNHDLEDFTAGAIGANFQGGTPLASGALVFDMLLYGTTLTDAQANTVGNALAAAYGGAWTDL